MAFKGELFSGYSVTLNRMGRNKKYFKDSLVYYELPQLNEPSYDKTTVPPKSPFPMLNY